MTAATSGPVSGPGTGPVPVPVSPTRDAATVVLLRDMPAGLETWLLTRHLDLAFAAGMSVYPGGRVDPADGLVPLARPGRVDEVAAAFGIARGRAHALVVAAARETFEETGVLLSVPTRRADASPAEPAADPSPLELTAARTAVEAGELAFGDLLAQQGRTVDGDVFVPWARWITPTQEKRRYDTFFFVAALPAGAKAADVTTESSSAEWVGVATALTDGRALMPPTRETLSAIGANADTAEVVAAASGRELAPVRPVLHRGPDGTLVELPDGRRLPIPLILQPPTP